MPETVLKFNFKAAGADTPVQAFKDLARQAKAAKSSIQEFREAGQLGRNAASGTIALARAFKISFSEAQNLAKGLDLTAEEAASATRAIAELRSVGASSAQRFGVLRRELGLSAKQFRELDKRVDDTAESLSDFQRVAASIAALGLGQRLQAIASGVLQTGLVFERLKTTLTNLLGEAGADRAFEQIQEFAATTPFQLEEVTAAFISLKQRGLDPSNESLRAIGDIASSQGKSLQQFVEAILDATTGENERLKEFGISAQTAGDQVTFSFRNVNKTVERTPQAIQQALLSFGELQGVAGGMAAQAQTLGGQFSNLQDNTSRLSNEFFELAQGPAVAVLKISNDLLSTFFKLPAPLKIAVLSVGGLGAAFVAAVTAITAFNLAGGTAIVTQVKESAVITINTAKKTANTVATLAQAAATGKLSAAQLASVGAFAKNTAALAGAAAAVALVIDTYNSVTAAGNEIRTSIQTVDDALLTLAETQAKLKKSTDESNKSLSVEAQALANAQAKTSDFQKVLDGVRETINFVTLGFSNLSSAAESSVRGQVIAFSELNDRANTVANQGFKALVNANNLTTDELKDQIAAIDATIKAYETATVVTDSDARAKATNLKVFRQLREELDKFVPSADKVNAAIRKTAEEFKRLETEANVEFLRGQVRILEDVENGYIDAADSAAKSAQLQQQAAEDTADRLERQRQQLEEQLSAPGLEESQRKIINDQILELDQKLAKAQVDVVKGRISEQQRLEQEAVGDLEKTNAEVLADIKLAEQQRLNLIAGTLREEEDINRARLQSIQETLQQQIQATQQATAQLQSLDLTGQQDERREQQLRANRLQLAELTGQLIANERALQQQAIEEQLQGIEDIAQERQDLTDDTLQDIENQQQAESRRSQAQLTNLEREKEAQNRVAEAIEQQENLLDAQVRLQGAQRNLQSTRANIEIDNLNKALEIQKRLNEERLSPQVERALRNQLALLAGPRASDQSEGRLIERRLQREQELANIRRAQLNSELQSDRQRAALAERRLEIEIEIAQIAAQQAAINAQLATAKAQAQQTQLEAQLNNTRGQIQDVLAEIETLRREGGSQRDIRNAERRLGGLERNESGLTGQLAGVQEQVQLNRQNEVLTREQNAAILEQLENRRAIAALDRAALVSDEQTKRLQFEQEESARKLAAELTKAEAASRGIRVDLPEGRSRLSRPTREETTRFINQGRAVELRTQPARQEISSVGLSRESVSFLEGQIKSLRKDLATFANQRPITIEEVNVSTPDPVNDAATIVTDVAEESLNRAGL